MLNSSRYIMVASKSSRVTAGDVWWIWTLRGNSRVSNKITLFWSRRKLQLKKISTYRTGEQLTFCGDPSTSHKKHNVSLGQAIESLNSLPTASAYPNIHQNKENQVVQTLTLKALNQSKTSRILTTQIGSTCFQVNQPKSLVGAQLEQKRNSERIDSYALLMQLICSKDRRNHFRQTSEIFLSKS